jgi:ribosomal protein S27E
MSVILTDVGCPDCESLNIVEVHGDIKCECLDCGFWWNEYAYCEE